MAEILAVHSRRALADPTLKGLLWRVIGKIFGNEHLIEGYSALGPLAV